MTQAELDYVRSQFELMFRLREPLHPFFAAIRKSKGNKDFALDSTGQSRPFVAGDPTFLKM